MVPVICQTSLIIINIQAERQNRRSAESIHEMMDDRSAREALLRQMQEKQKPAGNADLFTNYRQVGYINNHFGMALWVSDRHYWFCHVVFASLHFFTYHSDGPTVPVTLFIGTLRLFIFKRCRFIISIFAEDLGKERVAAIMEAYKKKKIQLRNAFQNSVLDKIRQCDVQIEPLQVKLDFIYIRVVCSLYRYLADSNSTVCFCIRSDTQWIVVVGDL